MSSATKKKLRRLSERDLTPDQNRAIDRCYDHNALLMVPVGFGKTVVSQTAAQDRIADKHNTRILVIAPLRVCTDVWAVEHESWDHLIRPAIAVGEASYRRAVIEDKQSQIVVINFDILPWFFDTYGSNHGFDGLIIDELTRFKAGGAQFKKLRHHLKDFNWRVGMTGTLAEEGLDGLFYQVMAVDGGRLFGRRKEPWLNEYFYPTDYEQRNWAARAGTSERIADLIEPLVFQAEYQAADGLPDLVVEVVPVKLPAGARAIYDQMCTDMYYENGDFEVEAVNAAVVSGKLQQICNGFMYGEDEQVEELHGAKRCEIGDLVRGHQCIVVYTFVHDLVVLREMFPGGRELRDDVGVVDQFNAGELQTLFLHPASGGHGLNLQLSGCESVVFYGPIWSRDRYDQVIGRVRRRGNAAEVVRVKILVATGTVEDEVVLPRVEGKAEVAALFRAHLAARVL